MTIDEQHRILGEMVAERRDLRTTITCLERKLDLAKIQLASALRTVNDARNGNIVGSESGVAYLGADELVDVLEQLREAHGRLETVTQALDGC